MTISLTATKEDILLEVMKATNYAAAKADDGQGRFDIQAVTEEDWEFLSGHFTDAHALACLTLRRLLLTEARTGGRLTITLRMPSAWDTALASSMQRHFESFLAASLTAAWWAIAHPEEVPAARQQAAGHLEALAREAFYKRPPVRPARGGATPTEDTREQIP